jgi:DNA-binding transcriptional MerR regulator
MAAYDSKMASRIVGVSLRQIQYWDEQGFVRPSVKPAEGRGSKRLYSYRDLICLKFMKDVTRRGLSVRGARRCLRPLRQYAVQSGQASQALKYLTDGEKLFVITSDREKILDAINREFVLAVGLGSLMRELNGDLRRATSGPPRKRARAVGRPDDSPGGTA